MGLNDREIEMKRLTAVLCMLVVLSGCSITPKATLMSRETGARGTGVIENVAYGNSGPMTVSFKDQTFKGKWVAVRNPGNTSFGLLTSYGLGGVGIGTGTQVTQSDSGYGTALLSSNNGDTLRCEYRYSLTTITAIGVCQKKNGEIFDLQVG